MLIIRQHRIYRQDLKANPKLLYIFGDNIERVGFGGQAKEMRGENNAFGIATKRKAAHGTPDCYFHDSDADVMEILENEFDALDILLNDVPHCYAGIVIPLDGIGTGLAKMSEYAPKALEYINQQLKNLEIEYAN